MTALLIRIGNPAILLPRLLHLLLHFLLLFVLFPHFLFDTALPLLICEGVSVGVVTQVQLRLAH